MNENQKTAVLTNQAKRARWQRPTVRHLQAGQAEAAGAPVADVVFS